MMFLSIQTLSRGDYSQLRTNCKRFSKRNPNTALYISMGDLVDNGEQAYQWRGLNSIKPLSANVRYQRLLKATMRCIH